MTRSYLPDLETYKGYIERIWRSGWLTNHGELSLELEDGLRDYLDVPYFLAINNGTTALDISMKALGVEGEVITTPFSYVATTSVIQWRGTKPVFVDIDPDSWNIDPEQIEAAITERTTAVLATHVFGNPCDVERIRAIADKHGLKVIYDAAHAFGVQMKSGSLLNYGNLSALSFHATKLFHTVEGGGIVCKDEDLAHRIHYMRNFGHKDYESYWGEGINGKMSEFHAAMGLSMLPVMPEILERRRVLSERYNELLKGTDLQTQTLHSDLTSYNHPYYPVLFPDEKSLLVAVDELEADGISPRRYFHPTLDQLPYIDENYHLPNSWDVSARILCLPLYPELSEEEQDRVVQRVKKALEKPVG